MESYTKLLESVVFNSDEKKLIVFDVGCNIDNNYDDFTELFLTKYPNSISYAFDPLHWKTFYQKWKDDNRVVLIKKALSDEVQKKEIYIPLNPGVNGLSSFFNRPYFGGQTNTAVLDCTTIDVLFDEFNLKKIHYLKIDTEGAEMEILKGAKNSLKNKKIDYVQVEYGGCYDDAGYSLSDVENYLNSYGYYLHLKPSDLPYGDVLFTSI